MCLHQMLVNIFPLMSTSKIRLLCMMQLDPAVSANDSGMRNLVCRRVLDNSMVCPDRSQGKIVDTACLLFIIIVFPVGTVFT